MLRTLARITSGLPDKLRPAFGLTENVLQSISHRQTNVHHGTRNLALSRCVSSKINVVLSSDIKSDNDATSGKTATELLSELGPEEDKRLRIIQMEYDVAFASGYKVPENVTDEMWLYLLTECSSMNGRRRQMNFWWTKEMYKKKRAEKRERNLEILEQKTEELNRLKAEGIWTPPDNRFIFRVRDAQMNRFYNSKLVHAINFGQDMVFDMDYDEYMSKGEHQNTVDQMLDCYGINKKHRDSFHMHLCNANPDSKSMYRWNKHQSTLKGSFDLTTHTEKCYTEIFDKDKLVYLTPNARSYLKEFDNDAAYIIGAFVDKSCREPISFTKAKRQGIKMAKLPVDLYLDWGSGTKHITLNQVFNILLDFKLTGDWRYALRHIPRRKIKSREQLEEERSYKMMKYRRRPSRNYYD